MPKPKQPATSDAPISDVSNQSNATDFIAALISPSSTEAVSAIDTPATEPEEENPENPDVDEVLNPDEDTPEDNSEEENLDEPESTDEDDEENEDISTFTPEQQKVFGKAIGKVRQKYRSEKEKADALTSENEELISELDQLKVQLSELEASKSLPVNSSNPLFSSIQDEAALDVFLNEQYDIKDQLISNENDDGDSFVSTSKGDFTIPAAKLKKAIASIEKNISLYVPDLKRFFARNKRENDTLATIPELSQKNSELSLAVNSIIARNPALKQNAGYKVKAYHMALGEKLVATYGNEAWQFAKKTNQAPKSFKKLERTPPKPVSKKETAATAPARPKIERITKPITAKEAEDHLAKLLNS